jgi:hypothetical protein
VSIVDRLSVHLCLLSPLQSVNECIVKSVSHTAAAAATVQVPTTEAELLALVQNNPTMSLQFSDIAAYLEAQVGSENCFPIAQDF